MKILELKQNIFKENEVTADKIRDEFKKQKKLMINGDVFSRFGEDNNITSYH